MKSFVNTELEMKKLGENIHVARKRRHMTLAELAAKSSVSKTAILRIEEGDTTVGIGKIFNVLEALGLLRKIAAVTDPDLDREQVLKEIKELREEKSKKTSYKKKSLFVRDFEE